MIRRAEEALRVAICTDTFPPQVNGVARTLERLADAIEARGGCACVLTVQDPEAEAERASPRDVTRLPSVPYARYPQLRIAAPSSRDATALFTRFRPTLVHVATPFGVGLGACRAARALQLPLVTSYHTHFASYLRHYRLPAFDGVAWSYLRWFHNSGRRTYAPTEVTRAELEERGFRGTAVWSRGVDRQRFHRRFRSHDLRGSLGVSQDQLIVLYVGRLAPEKNIPVLFDAVRQLSAEVAARLRLVVTGDGPSLEELRAIAPRGTHFTGRLDGEALSRMYASADLFVCPSTTETFGNVVLEAMASGVPVLAPDRGATTEFAHADTAQCYRAGDAAALRHALHELVLNEPRRIWLQASGLQQAGRHDWNAIFDALIDDYRTVIAEHAERRQDTAVLQDATLRRPQQVWVNAAMP
jgi:glycosyltransferase involved in cell wall biosynthesis